jgi:hypothetical protein
MGISCGDREVWMRRYAVQPQGVWGVGVNVNLICACLYHVCVIEVGP